MFLIRGKGMKNIPYTQARGGAREVFLHKIVQKIRKSTRALAYVKKKQYLCALN